ncbi:hypothetical protein SG18_02160 [Pandoraea apista]|nr:hypothetical protein SG18_02160 [Pandoraea apista]AKH71235.1 hypothetical protein XM39_02160 [Pandoraea apista]AKI63507.1 hypothetical protein AA956_19480 [Pandoraea apista]
MSGATSVPVVVDEESIDVWVIQVGKSWRARAFFHGREITGSGATQSSALSDWRHRANHVANE